MQYYFPHNYFSAWFPKHYFILIITEGPSKGEIGGGWLTPGAKLYPDELFEKPEPIVIYLNKQTLNIELPNVIARIAEIFDTDEDEALVLIQIISELPHAQYEQFLEMNKDNIDEIMKIIEIVIDKTKK